MDAAENAEEDYREQAPDAASCRQSGRLFTFEKAAAGIFLYRAFGWKSASERFSDTGRGAGYDSCDGWKDSGESGEDRADGKEQTIMEEELKGKKERKAQKGEETQKAKRTEGAFCSREAGEADIA